MLSEDEYNLLSKTQHDNPDLYALFEKIIGSYSGSLNHLTHEFRNIITLINALDSMLCVEKVNAIL